MKEESCLQTEGHSRVLRVSYWRVRERVSLSEFDSGELEREEEDLRALGKTIKGLLRDVRRLVSCIGGFKQGKK